MHPIVRCVCAYTAVLGSVLGVLLGCDTAEPAATQVMVVIDAESSARAQIRAIDVEVTSGEGASADWTVRYAGSLAIEGSADWPQEIALRPRHEHDERGYEVTVNALDADGRVLARVRAISGYLPGRSLRLPLYFDEACVMRTELCGETLTCVSGACVDAYVDPAWLKQFSTAPGQPVRVIAPGRDADAGLDTGIDTEVDAGCAPGDITCVPTIDCPAERCGTCDPGFVLGAGDACEPLLTGLGLSAGSLSPALDATTTGYSVTVPLFVQPLWITPVAAAEVEVRIDGQAVDSAGAFRIDDVALTERTVVLELVHPAHGRRTYQLRVRREARQRTYLKASNAGAGDEFGYIVAVDGDRIVVGAPGEDGASVDTDDDDLEDSGAAYVFVRDGDSYREQARLKAPVPGLWARFGAGVAVRGDTVVVGASGEGAIYVFEQSGSGWGKPVRLQDPSGIPDNEFGRVLTFDGQRIAAGVPGEDSSTFDDGTVYVYERAGDAWSTPVRVTPELPQLAGWFGSSVALDGDWLAVGATGETTADIGSGSAYVFERDGSVYRQRARLVSNQRAGGDLFGEWVGFANERLLVGGMLQGTSQPLSGTLTLFERNAGGWSETQRLAAINPNGFAYFGLRAAFANDLIVSGAHEDDGGGSGVGAELGASGAENSGTVYVFVRRGARYEPLTAIKAAAPSAHANFGNHVALVDDVLVVGALGESSNARGVDGDENDTSAPRSGAAYVFR